ncbi:MAG TPA: DPP IV N-terminal domain-containing protein [Bacteroidales bacterium]|nr:DPP IV N-terminal domain-containing protein [Bacteroidales bacterium]
MKNKASITTSISFLLFFLTLSLGAQVTEKDYERANSLDKTLSGKVFHSDIMPSWIGSTHMFLYENLNPGGREYIIIDADKKIRRPAFDAKKVAAGMVKATGDTLKADNLQLRNIKITDDLKSMTFDYSDTSYTCDLKSYTIKKGEASRRPSQYGGGTNRWPWGFQNELEGRPVTSPDKKLTAFIRDYNVWIRNESDKKESKLSVDGGIGRYYSASIVWSPDSKKLMTCKIQPAEKHMISYIESSPADQVQPKYYTYEYPKPGDAVPQAYPQIFDVAESKHTVVDESAILNQYDVSNFKWDSLGTSLTFEYNKRGHQVYRVMKIDAVTGKMSIVIDEQSDTFIDYSGKKYRYDLPATGEIIWASERDGWNHLWLYDSETGKVKNQITKGEWVVRRVSSVDKDKREIIFQASGREPGDPYLIHYYRIKFDGTGLTHLTPGDGNHVAVFSEDNKYLTDVFSRADMPPVAVLRSASDGSEIMEIEKADITALKATGWQPAEVFTAKGRDGVTDIWGIIVRPLNFDPSKKYPVIENIYAGPHGSFVPKSFRPSFSNMNSLAELGFIVVQIDGMGTSNRSIAFQNVAWKNIKDAGFPDRILWMQAAAAKYPYMDITRVGIYGTSAGGQNSAGAVLFHPEFYDVAVSACGCQDNRMDKIWWNEQWMGWPVDQSYIESSNVENAWRLKGKLLLINGEMDNNVDPASTVQLVNALIKAGKDFDYLLVPGMLHSSGGSYGERRRMDFFVENLIGDVTPDWNKKEVTKK